MRPPTRDELLSEYDSLTRQLVKAGIDPVVSDAVLDVFSDGELAALVKDAARRLLEVRRFQA